MSDAKKQLHLFHRFFVKNPFHCDTYLNLVHLSDVVLTHAVKLASGFQCGLCSYTSERKYNMRLHLDGSHGLGWGRYQCNQCHLQLKTQARLTQHKQVCCN